MLPGYGAAISTREVLQLACSKKNRVVADSVFFRIWWIFNASVFASASDKLRAAILFLEKMDVVY